MWISWETCWIGTIQFTRAFYAQLRMYMIIYFHSPIVSNEVCGYEWQLFVLPGLHTISFPHEAHGGSMLHLFAAHYFTPASAIFGSSHAPK